jgi:hypothetical protein
VNEPAEAVCPPYAADSFELMLGQVGDRYLEVDPAVRVFVVVV